MVSCHATVDRARFGGLRCQRVIWPSWLWPSWLCSYHAGPAGLPKWRTIWSKKALREMAEGTTQAFGATFVWKMLVAPQGGRITGTSGDLEVEFNSEQPQFRIGTPNLAMELQVRVSKAPGNFQAWAGFTQTIYESRRTMYYASSPRTKLAESLACPCWDGSNENTPPWFDDPEPLEWSKKRKVWECETWFTDAPWIGPNEADPRLGRLTDPRGTVATPTLVGIDGVDSFRPFAAVTNSFPAPGLIVPLCHYDWHIRYRVVIANSASQMKIAVTLAESGVFLESAGPHNDGQMQTQSLCSEGSSSVNVADANEWPTWIGATAAG